jgi:hypothetical protein
MDAVANGSEPAPQMDAELREIEARLRGLAADLIERSQTPGPAALDLLTRGTELQRAAFVVASAGRFEVKVA